MTLVKARQVSAQPGRLALGVQPDAQPERSAAPGDPRDALIRDLEARLRDALDVAAALEASIDARELAALERGREEGEASATARLVQDWTAQEDAFLDAISGCAAQIDHRFVELESFALDLAETALARILGEPERFTDLMVATIAHHAGGLSAETVVAIRVSEEDLPDASRLVASLSASLGARVRVTSDLAPGECRVDLLAGSMDLTLRQQAAHMSAAFARLRA